MGFYTSQWIEVKNTRLGGVYNALLVLGLAVVLWKSVINKAYLEYDSPVGFVNAKVTKWKGSSSESRAGYCSAGCRVMDEYEVQYPDAQDSSLLLTTRVKEDVELLQPNGQWVRNSSRNFYVQQVEKFVIKVEHSFEVPHFREQSSPDEERLYAGSSRMMRGTFKKSDGSREELAVGKPDSFLLNELVVGAGLGLEQLADGKEGEDEPIRSRGMVLLVSINYKNTNKRDWTVHNPTYTYTVKKVPYTEFKIAQELSRSEGSRVLWKRYGIKLVFVQTGRIGRFSASHMITELVAGLTLLSLAQIVCDFYAYYFSPQLKQLMIKDCELPSNTQTTHDEGRAGHPETLHPTEHRKSPRRP
eukprot:TRINITY_DN54620_c0_g1_i2.p1 TRINITY_DN54620_c0_g1~~TRINITY_DN54620_c0_g1_i2.p1  ORF type:complete len:358 (+),score=83.96 TRINITY_DN54620_c0_g1_i2:143-1216(+)